MAGFRKSGLPSPAADDIPARFEVGRLCGSTKRQRRSRQEMGANGV